ncbi:MAG: valine--tRNA ligase [Phycisphaerales bacterium]|nr:valine--tRNA ligase [Phycisphaerales bacterium]
MTSAQKSAENTTTAGGQSPGGELPKAYVPREHEGRVWSRWIEARAFHADPARVLRGEAEPYCVLIPPPNVTAALHLGHALNNALQDILVRAHRMMGYETMWMPGTDHAGIATQAVVEKRVWQEEKKRRTDFTREAFIAKIQAFKDEYEATITGQLKAMGCSCDWDRQRFTMDEQCARAVREAFFRLFKDGLIYRGKRLVNWDPALQTAVSDDECYDEEVDSFFYYLRYPVVHPHGATTSKERRQGKLPPADAVPVTWSELASRGFPGAEEKPGEEQAWVTVATTRPETYLADTALAVNPHDPRAKALRGLCVELPLVGRVIPIIEDSYVVLPKAMARTDEEAADPKAEFATGFLKVTPGHDTNDYDLYQRHKETMDTFAGGPGAALINMMSPDGRVSDQHGWTDVGDAHLLVGKTLAEARKLVVKEFEARTVDGGGEVLLEGTRPYRHSLKFSDRSKAVIEPYLSDQWYVKVTDPRMAPAANRALVEEQGANQQSEKQHSSKSGTDGRMRFYPARYAKTYETWHDNIRDWCISRQLWWGHRIPVWTLFPRLPNLSRNIPDFGVEPKGYREELGRRFQRFAESINCPQDFQLFDRGWIGSEYQVYLCVRSTKAEALWCQAIEIINGEAKSLMPTHEQSIAALDLGEAVGKVSQQDPDVLDTWFSSALWPMSTMGWPEPTDLLKAFNPSTSLSTAREIITLWVSRMVMFNRYFMPAGWEGTRNAPDHRLDAGATLDAMGRGGGPAPFRDVFIHAVIQDGEGRKMSKTLGNGVDPLDIIATHGSDAMRFTLCQMATNTQDVRMPVVKDPASGRNTSPKFDLGRNFCNKLWNAARFAMMMAQGARAEHPIQRAKLPTVDRWMLSRLARAIGEVNQSLANYEFAGYAQTMYTLLWNDFCDWYLEAIKPTVASDPGQRAVLRSTLDAIVRLLHPIAPFVTEAVHEKLSTLPTAPIDGLQLGPARKAGLLCTAGWPVAAESLIDERAEAQFGRLQALVTAIREVRAQHNVKPSRRITLHADGPAGALVQESGGLVETLALLARVTSPGERPGPAVSFRFEGAELFLSDLADAVDAGAEQARLTKLLTDLDKAVATYEGRLANPGYAQKAPPAMVEQTRQQLAKAKEDREATAALLRKLG